MEPYIKFSITFAWIMIIGGFASGAIIGLFFHKDEWLNGYSSFTRRMFRLGHISFFGISIINLLFSMTIVTLEIKAPYLEWCTYSIMVGGVAMPLLCYASGIKKYFRHLFFIPVTSLILPTLYLIGVM